MSDGEGSLYDKGSDEEELNMNRKKRRKEMLARGLVPGEKTQKKNKKGQKPMAGLVLPVPGEKTVAAEAFGKMNPTEKELVAHNINRKTKKEVHIYTHNLIPIRPETMLPILTIKVARESAKQIICDLGHQANIKAKLKEFLLSEVVPISEMAHEGAILNRSIEEQGSSIICLFFKRVLANILLSNLVACNVGDWVQVESDYSPGICSEGGTGVVIAKDEGDT
jgi:hypothetical protein